MSDKVRNDLVDTGRPHLTSNHEIEYDHMNSDNIPYTVVCCILIALIMLGNGTILAIVFWRKELKTPRMIYIISLVTSDLMIATIVIPLAISTQYKLFAMTSLVCKISEFLKDLTITANLYCVVAIATDRHLIITSIFKARPPNSRPALFVFFVWLFAAVYSLRPVFTHGLTTHEDNILHEGMVLHEDEQGNKSWDFVQSWLQPGNQSWDFLGSGLEQGNQSWDFLGSGLEQGNQSREFLESGLGEGNQSREFLESGVEKGNQSWEFLESGVEQGNQSMEFLKSGFTERNRSSKLLESKDLQNFTTFEEHSTCGLEIESLRQLFILLDFFIICLLPLLIISILYTRVILWLVRQRRHNCAVSRSKNQNIKLIQMVLVIVLTYTVCQLPSHIFLMYVYFGPGVDTNAEFIYDILTIFTYFNSVLNVCIYSLFDSRINTFVKMVFCCDRRVTIPDIPSISQTPASQRKVTSPSSRSSSSKPLNTYL